MKTKQISTIHKVETILSKSKKLPIKLSLQNYYLLWMKFLNYLNKKVNLYTAFEIALQTSSSRL